jgi:hypothetical protein
MGGFNGRECGRRVGKLYLPPRARDFGCRRCHNLIYRSSQHAHAFDRLLTSIGPSWASPSAWSNKT